MGAIRRRVIEGDQRFKLAGICDTNPQKRANIHDCPVFASFEELLGQDPDAVFVCTPPNYSAAICVQSLLMGKHVFCENPPGKNVEDIKNIRKSEPGNAKLVFSFNLRFHPAVAAARAVVDSGSLGKIVSLRGSYACPGPGADRPVLEQAVTGGGTLLNQGINMLDLFLYFCGAFDSVKCFTSNSSGRLNAEDNASLIMKNKNSQTALLSAGTVAGGDVFRLGISLEQGYLIVSAGSPDAGGRQRSCLIAGRRAGFEAAGGPLQEAAYFDEDISHQKELDEFAGCVLEDRKVIYGTSADALKAMELIERAYLDSYSSDPAPHKAVQPPEASGESGNYGIRRDY